MIDREQLMLQTLDDASYQEESIALTAIDLTLDTVVALLRSKEREHTERGNKISALVVADILKEFY